MYAELHSVWKNETERRDLQELKSDFYVRAANYLKLLTEERRMLDKKTVRSKLLKVERENALGMMRIITDLRYHKMLRNEKSQVQPAAILPEERMVFESLSGCFDRYSEFVEKLARGQLAASHEERSNYSTFALVRFLKDVPDLVGADMRLYGPFRREDVASLPTGNSNILVKKGLAAKIETN